MARDGRRLGQAQQVGVAAQVARMVAEPLAAEIGFGEPVGLEHRAHRPVEHEDPLAQEVRQERQPRRPVERRHATTATGWRARIRRTSSAHCS